MLQSKPTSFIEVVLSVSFTIFKNTIRKRKFLVGVLVVILYIVATTLIFQQKTKTLAEFNSPRISFKYPKYYQEQPKLDPVKNQAKNLIKLKSEGPVSFIILAEEKNAIRGANLLKTNFLDFLERNAERKFPIVYDDYQKQKTERIKISGRDASLMSFSYTGDDNKTTVYVNLFIIPLDNDAYYLTIQSPDESKLDSDTEKVQPTIEMK